jgi:hypothetical protein
MSRRRSLHALLLVLAVFALCGAADAARLALDPSALTAGEPVVVEMKVTAPEGGVATGGRVRVPQYMKLWNGLIDGLSEDWTSNGLVSTARSDGGEAEARNVSRNPDFAILSDLEVEITGSALAEGGTLTVRLGTDEQKVRTTRKQRRLLVEAEWDADGDGTFEKLPPPDLRVRAAEPVSLHLVGPSIPRADGPEKFVVWAEDRFGNVCEDYARRLTVTPDPPEAGESTVYQMHAWDENVDLDRNEFELDVPGWTRLNVEDPQLGLRASSNPMTGEPGEGTQPRLSRLYWGEIHVHSQISDGKGEPADIYRDGYAKGLDFVAITDHSFGREARGSLNERLVAMCREAERFNRPGEFVTIPAVETHYLPNTHMNIYFSKADPARMLRLHHALREARPTDEEAATPEGRTTAGRRYWSVLGSPDFADFALAFPHHTMWVGYPEFINADLQRVIEICSTHGSSETRDPTEVPEGLRMKKWRQEAGTPDSKYSVREALAAGNSLAFVGGSDDHNGQPGSKALTAVWTDELTRDGILTAIRGRHCYATSGNRAVVLGVASNRSAVWIVTGDGPMDRIDYFAGGERVGTDTHAGSFTTVVRMPGLHDPPLDEAVHYVRVILADGGAAWSTLTIDTDSR